MVESLSERALGAMLTARNACLALVLSLSLATCAYPRKSTPLSAVPNLRTAPSDTPDDLWKLIIVSADVPRTQRSGLPWDEAKGAPDPYVRLYVNGRELWRSPTVTDSLRPEFNASPPRNLAVARNERLRLELWDEDAVGGDPIGVYEGRALGEAILDAETTLKLEGGATLTVRVARPEPHAGTGIALYEIRKTALHLLEILPRSPAARAGLKAGDQITAIDGKTIDQLGPRGAESALVLAAQRESELTVVSPGESPRAVTLDKGYVWLSM